MRFSDLGNVFICVVGGSSGVVAINSNISIIPRSVAVVYPAQAL